MIHDETQAASQDDLLVGIPEAGRSANPVLQKIMGFFVLLGSTGPCWSFGC